MLWSRFPTFRVVTKHILKMKCKTVVIHNSIEIGLCLYFTKNVEELDKGFVKFMAQLIFLLPLSQECWQTNWKFRYYSLLCNQI